MSQTAAGGKPRRAYRSPQRTEQAQRTRERIVTAASEQFVQRGYTATTLRSVAGAAGVSVSSIELAFGTKANLLKTAIDVAIAGDHAPVAVLDRAWAAQAQAATDVRAFLTAVAVILRPAMARSAGLVLAAYDAAGTDPDLDDLVGRLADQRATVVGWIVDGIRQRAALRAGLTRHQAIDEVWLLMEPAVYQRLLCYRHWSSARYQAWFTDAVSRLLLE